MLVKDKNLMKSSTLGAFPTIQCLYSTIPREMRMHMFRVSRYAQEFMEAIYEDDFALLRALPQGTTLISQAPQEEILEYSQQIFMLHDIGKSYIPMEIYNKVEKLTPEELQIIRNHTINVLKAEQNVFFPIFPENIMPYFRQVALYHHERWDGSGYPEGKQGTEIPFMARVCTICDTYDGMVCWKPYKAAKTHEEAIAIIENGAGKDYDPVLTQAFHEIQGEISHMEVIMNGREREMSKEEEQFVEDYAEN